jgi:hypothetical protein
LVGKWLAAGHRRRLGPKHVVTTPEFRAAADQLFGFTGSEKQARTVPGWLTPERVDLLLTFCVQVADAYKAALIQDAST